MTVAYAMPLCMGTRAISMCTEVEISPSRHLDQPRCTSRATQIHGPVASSNAKWATRAQEFSKRSPRVSHSRAVVG